MRALGLGGGELKHLRFVAVGGLLAALLVPAASASAASAIVVRPGGSIQDALNRAPSGGTVIVERGTYKGNLLIEKSVRLIGHGAVIVPDTSTPPTPNLCPPITGICAVGTVTVQGVVTKAINNVSISGFTVRGFSDDGILALGVNGFTAVNNTLINNGGYGIFANQSSRIQYLWNVARNNHEPGFYIGDSPAANATVVGNQSIGNLGEGILFRDATGGRITGNLITGNCAGIFVLDTGAPGGAGNVSVMLNNVTANNRLCPGEEGEAPPLGGIGIALIGAHNTSVVANLVRGNRTVQGSALPSGGVLLIDGGTAGGAAPMNNSIRNNVLSGNTPSDILTDGTGTGNTISGNSCSASIPPGSC